MAGMFPRKCPELYEQSAVPDAAWGDRSFFVRLIGFAGGKHAAARVKPEQGASPFLN